MHTRALSSLARTTQPRSALPASRSFGALPGPHAAAPALVPATGAGAMLPGVRSANVVQRKIAWNGKKYTARKGRPAWLSSLKSKVASDFNKQRGTSLTGDSRLPGTDRAHRIPYAALEELVIDYCNGEARRSELQELTDSLYGTTSEE